MILLSSDLLCCLMTSVVCMHDVYDSLSEDEKCQKTYVVQFLRRDLSSDFDVVGPYFNCSSSMEAHFLHSMVTRTMLAFSQFGFQVRALLCDGASSNLSLLKYYFDIPIAKLSIQPSLHSSHRLTVKMFISLCAHLIR